MLRTLPPLISYGSAGSVSHAFGSCWANHRPCCIPTEAPHWGLNAMASGQRERCQRSYELYISLQGKKKKKLMLWVFQEEFEFQHETTFQTWLTHPISQFPSTSPSLSLAHSIHIKVCVQTQTPFVSVNSGLFSLNGKAASNVGISQMKWATVTTQDSTTP